MSNNPQPVIDGGLNVLIDVDVAAARAAARSNWGDLCVDVYPPGPQESDTRPLGGIVGFLEGDDAPTSSCDLIISPNGGIRVDKIEEETPSTTPERRYTPDQLRGGCVLPDSVVELDRRRRWDRS